MGKAISFIFGASVGILIGWSFAKRYYSEAYDTDKEMDIIRESNDSEKKTNSQIIIRNNYDSVESTYIITPKEFGSIEEYCTVSLYYFEDGVITDDAFVPIDDGIFGSDFSPADHFGEYEDDTVFMRSDIRKCDYEILRDGRAFAEVEN